MRHYLHLVLLFILAACSATPTATQPSATPAPEKLIVAGWAGYMPQAVLDAFSAETGIAVEYVVYESQFDVIDQLRAGVEYDVVVMGNTLIPTLVAEGLLAPIDYSLIPNFRYVSVNFRDLTYDLGGRYSVVYQWGVGGLVVRARSARSPDHALGRSVGSGLGWQDRDVARRRPTLYDCPESNGPAA